MLKTLSEKNPPNSIFKNSKSKKNESKKRFLKSPPATDRDNYKASPTLKPKYGKYEERKRSPKRLEKTKTLTFLASATSRNNRTKLYLNRNREQNKMVSTSLNYKSKFSRNKSAPLHSLYKTMASRFANKNKGCDFTHCSSSSGKKKSKSKSKDRPQNREDGGPSSSFAKRKFYKKNISAKTKNHLDIIKVSSAINHLIPSVFKDITNNTNRNRNG